MNKKKLVIKSILLMMLFLNLLGMKTKAAKPEFPKTISIYYVNDNYSNLSWISVEARGERQKSKVTKLKSSNEKVLVVDYSKDGKFIMLTAKKPGKATLSFKVKRAGKTYSYKCVVKVHKYKNPLKTFKIGKKDFRSKYKNNVLHKFSKGTKTYSGKLRIKEKKGFVITSMWIIDTKTRNTKIVQNGDKIKLKSDRHVLMIEYYDKSIGYLNWLELY